MSICLEKNILIIEISATRNHHRILYKNNNVHRRRFTRHSNEPESKRFESSYTVDKAPDYSLIRISFN